VSDHRYDLRVGDCIDGMRSLPDGAVNTCITSPPYYGLRDYGCGGQIGLEDTPEKFVQRLVGVFREVRRVLRGDGTLWLNLGDTYSSGGRGGGAEGSMQAANLGSVTGEVFKPWKVQGYREKNLLGIPWKVAFALQADGWYLRQDIIWSKPNPMPESVTDRCTKAHEYLFLLSKSAHYHYDHEAIKEPAQNWGTRDRSEMRDGTTDPLLKHHGLQGKEWEENPMRNKRSVWTVNPKPYHAFSRGALGVAPCSTRSRVRAQPRSSRCRTDAGSSAWRSTPSTRQSHTHGSPRRRTRSCGRRCNEPRR
jgi:hypothetical protein